MIGSRVGRYRIVAKLGQGGLATVWKAHDELLGRPVALKVLSEQLAVSPKARRRFLHDAQALAALDHPGIIAVYDTGEASGLVYIALSLIDGETVSERAAARLMPFDEAVRVVREAAGALGHAHERGVIHRDVTGRNIMIARDGRVFVLDFGLALAAGESRVTTTGTALGTILYMAPEVIQAREADARSDLYGLGVVLYEALTGSFPFSAEQPQAVFYTAMHTAPVPPRDRRPDIPEALERVVLKAIAREPADRHQSAEEFIAALDALGLGDAGAPARQDDTRAPGRAPHRAPVAEGRVSTTADTVAIPLADGRRGPIYLAILPFEAEPADDPERACETLASRLAETLGNALAGAPGVRVVATAGATSSADSQALAQRLGAGVLLRGCVRRAGSEVRVSYSLLDPVRGLQLGGAVVDGSAFHVFEVEDRVVASVTRTLGLEPPKTAAPASRPADPVEHERYLQALGYLKRFDNEASVDGAIRILERLTAEHPDVAVYHAALARAFMHKQIRTEQRQWEGRAAGECARARELDADSPEVRIAMGELAWRTGRYAAAIEDFTEVLRRHPGDYDATLGIARAHAAAGQRDEAERACEQAIALAPKDWRGYHTQARARFQAGDFAGAVESWRRVVELNQDNALGRRHLGSALYMLDRFDEAIAAYRESLALQPNDEAYQNLGTTLYYLGRHEEAISALRKATELMPSSPYRWGALGSACRWLAGREREAEVALDRAIGLMRERLERDPTQAESWALLAGWLINRGRRDEAEVAVHRALDLAPRDVHCMVRAGHVYFHLGDRERCLHWFREARRAGFGAQELRRSPDLASLREDPEFVRIVEEAPAASDAPDQSVPGKQASRADAA